MRYGANITKRICKELEKVPNIRYVCIKVGIDHSTFYRWRIRHPTFSQEIEMALFVGRQSMNDIAETVIIKGVQESNFRASTFWLTHNDPRFMQKEKAVHHYNLLEQFKATLESTVKLDGSNFETLFDSFGKLEKAIGFKIAQLLLDPIIKLFCKADEKLVDIFYDSYEEWKTNEQLDKDRQKACGVPGSKQSP